MILKPDHGGELFGSPRASGLRDRSCASEADICTYIFVLNPTRTRLDPSEPSWAFGSLQTVGLDAQAESLDLLPRHELQFRVEKDTPLNKGTGACN